MDVRSLDKRRAERREHCGRERKDCALQRELELAVRSEHGTADDDHNYKNKLQRCALRAKSDRDQKHPRRACRLEHLKEVHLEALEREIVEHDIRPVAHRDGEVEQEKLAPRERFPSDTGFDATCALGRRMERARQRHIDRAFVVRARARDVEQRGRMPMRVAAMVSKMLELGLDWPQRRAEHSHKHGDCKMHGGHRQRELESPICGKHPLV
eukprot:Amastigsp_a841235_14.p3 type:complete len:212 gc:universal Amastigsp_a841235_14:740-1375(+)